MDERTGQWAESGLHAYVGQIAAGLGVGLGATTCEVADFAAAYIALTERLPNSPDHDVALVWDQHRGWALTIEPADRHGMLVLAYQRETLLPTPATVLAFVNATLKQPPGEPGLPPTFEAGELATQLAAYATGHPPPRQQPRPSTHSPSRTRAGPSPDRLVAGAATSGMDDRSGVSRVPPSHRRQRQ